MKNRKKIKGEEEELRAASFYARSLIEASLDPLVTIGPDGRITDVNEATAKVTGVARKKLIGSDFSDYFTEPARAREGYQKVFKKGFVTDYPLIIRHTSGKLTEVLYSASVYKDEAGKVQGVFAAARDITERKRAEEALRESESKFKRLYDSNIIGVIFWDTAGNITQGNSEFLRIVGYTEDDLLSGRVRWKDMTPPEYAPLDEKALKEMAATEVSTPFEKEYIRKDGSRVPVVIGAVFLKGQKDAGICFVLDISERKQAEQELRKHRDHLEEMVKERTAEVAQKSEILQRQAQEILEISTPVLQIWKGVVVAPLIGTLDSQRTQKFMERLLARIVETNSPVALIDITGVPTIDTQTAQHLINTISAVRLLGAQVVLTGVRPAIAQTLVHLGVDMSEVTARSSLASGLIVAMNSLGLELSAGKKAGTKEE